MAQADDPERRGSVTTDRRQMLRCGGRRENDENPPELDLRIACAACGVAWASLSSVGNKGAQLMATYICPRCGHHEPRAVLKDTDQELA
jgi:transcription elongation factor Elf1